MPCCGLCFIRISPSDGDSLGSEPFSERDSPKANTRQTGLSSDPKQPRKTAPIGLNGKITVPRLTMLLCYKRVMMIYMYMWLHRMICG